MLAEKTPFALPSDVNLTALHIGCDLITTRNPPYVKNYACGILLKDNTRYKVIESTEDDIPVLDTVISVPVILISVYFSHHLTLFCLQIQAPSAKTDHREQL